MQGAVGTIVFSLWLPILVLVISFVRFSGDWIVEGPGVTGILWLVGLAWPAAIPLTLGVRRILRRSHRLSRILGYGCAVVLGLVSAWGVIVGGLFGPIGVVAYPWWPRCRVDHLACSPQGPGKRRRAGFRGVAFRWLPQNAVRAGLRRAESPQPRQSPFEWALGPEQEPREAPTAPRQGRPPLRVAPSLRTYVCGLPPGLPPRSKDKRRGASRN